MSLLKPVHTTTMSTPYEQLFIQNFHHNGKLIPEQHSGEPNPLLQLTIDTCLTSRTQQANSSHTNHSYQFQLNHGDVTNRPILDNL
jgi:hypothetical protein